MKDKMSREEILKQSEKKKNVVGEMETDKIRKGNWIAVIVAGIVAVIFAVSECAQLRHPAYFALLCVIFTWACTLYTCQYFLAKRPWQVLIGSVLYGLASIAMIVLYIISSVQGW